MGRTPQNHFVPVAGGIDTRTSPSSGVRTVASTPLKVKSICGTAVPRYRNRSVAMRSGSTPVSESESAGAGRDQFARAATRAESGTRQDFSKSGNRAIAWW